MAGQTHLRDQPVWSAWRASQGWTRPSSAAQSTTERPSSTTWQGFGKLQWPDGLSRNGVHRSLPLTSALTQGQPRGPTSQPPHSFWLGSATGSTRQELGGREQSVMRSLPAWSLQAGRVPWTKVVSPVWWPTLSWFRGPLLHPQGLGWGPSTLRPWSLHPSRVALP